MEQFLINKDQLQFILNTLSKITSKSIVPLKYTLPIIDIIRNVTPQKFNEEEHIKILDELSALKIEN